MPGLNIGDFSRYCSKPSAVYIQLIGVPALSSVPSIFAAITASCVALVHNNASDYYQPYDVVALWDGSAGGRAAMFLASLVWATSNVTTNM